MARRKTIVSPDLVPIKEPTSVMVDATHRVYLIPMAEWKQAAVRATRATIPAAAVLGGGGSVAAATSESGLGPFLTLGLPSTGIFVLDTLIVCGLIWIVWFAWNCLEFWMDWDETHPATRA